MKEQTLIVLAAGSLISPLIIVIAILVLAAIIIGFALYVRRGGKKNAAGEESLSSNWQPQNQSDAWNQQQPQQQSWGGQGAPQQQSWGGQGAPQQQSWGGQGAPQQNPWGNSPSQQQANSWGSPSSAQNMQQPGGNQWGSSPAQQGGNPWGAQQPQQQPQAQAANPWGAQQPQQAPLNQTQPGGQWGNQGNQGAQNPWEAAPAAAPVAPQDPWAAQQPGSNQAWNNAPAGSSPMQPQQGPNSFGGSATSGQGWGQQPAMPGQDPWAAQQQPQNQYGNAGGAPGANAWQQQSQPGYGQGYGAAQAPDPNAGYPDSDKTILRSAPQQPYAGNMPGAHTIGYVRVEEGKEPGRVYEIRKESLSIGRSRESDIFLEDLAVSRLHASVVNMGNDNYALKDEGSANGTKVNGQQVNKFQTYPLQDGDRIQLGQTVLVFGRK
jgi:FOG: FHA domain